MKITHICLIWVQKCTKLDIGTLNSFTITVISPADKIYLNKNAGPRYYIIGSMFRVYWYSHITHHVWHSELNKSIILPNFPDFHCVVHLLDHHMSVKSKYPWTFSPKYWIPYISVSASLHTYVGYILIYQYCKGKNLIHSVPLDMKGCICHFSKWQIHPFISKGTITWHESWIMSHTCICTDVTHSRPLTNLEFNEVTDSRWHQDILVLVALELFLILLFSFVGIVKIFIWVQFYKLTEKTKKLYEIKN